MLNRKKFIDTINFILKMHKIEEDANKVFKETDFLNFSFSEYQTVIIDLLEDIMGDKDGLISWWILENDYGKDCKGDDVKVNGKSFDLRTIDGLYDCLIYNK